MAKSGPPVTDLGAPGEVGGLTPPQSGAAGKASPPGKIKKPKTSRLVVKRSTVPPSVFFHTISDKEWEEVIAAACRQRMIGISRYLPMKKFIDLFCPATLRLDPSAIASQ